jgi:EAL domain-containing protein (putative c-di-GMP-specific phosphodiesterase class I)/DNA-binding NarL/FixJ family response regulator
MSPPAMLAAEIFVIDDKPANVALVCSVLRRAGFTRISPFTDAGVALDAAAHASPDLIVLDLHMPGVDGLEFLEQVRARRAHTDFVPTLVLTADTSRDALKSALRAGANDFATKPIDHDEILLRVHNLLSIRFAHEELKRHNVTLSSELRERAQFDVERAADRSHKIETMRTIIERGGPHMVFQPMVELATGRTLGVEALARFGTEPRRTPDQWFADAAAVGLGTELELSAVGAALRHLEALDPSWMLAINVSPSTIFADEFEALIRDVDLSRLAFEITEHQPIADYVALTRATGDLRARGALISVDDAGAGYASFRHILKLNPDVIKLDISLTRDVDHDPVKRALAASLERFAEDIGAAITAEGIETQAELDALRELGIFYGQGFFIAHPAPADSQRAFVIPPAVEFETLEAVSDA